MGKRINVAITLAVLLGSSVTLAQSYSSYDDCLEKHRQGLEDRHYEQRCKGSKAADCQKQYAEDYLKEVEKCRAQFSQSESKVTFPKDNSSLDCSQESKDDMQALGDSCLSLGQSSTSRCDPSESQRIISLASQKSTNNIQSSGATTQNSCQQAGQFNQEAASALQSFQAKCEPAISEGQSVCDRARSIVSRSSCSAALKSRFNATIDQGVNMFSQHRSTLQDARNSVQAAQNGSADAAKCAAQAAAGASDPAKKEEKPADSTDTAAAAASTTTAPPAPGATGGDVVGANSVAAPSAMAAIGAGNMEDGTGGGHLWDLPSTPSGAGSGDTVGSDIGGRPSKKDEDAAAKAAAAAAAKKAASSSVGGGSGGRAVAARRGVVSRRLKGLGPADRDPASTGAGKDEMPDLRQFLPGCIPKTGTDGMTGPECIQWQKIHVRYDSLLDGSEP